MTDDPVAAFWNALVEAWHIEDIVRWLARVIARISGQ
jgi:hypothetical protein